MIRVQARSQGVIKDGISAGLSHTEVWGKRKNSKTDLAFI